MYKCTCLIIDNVQIGSKGLILVRQSLSYNLLLSDSGDRRVEKAGNAVKEGKAEKFTVVQKKTCSDRKLYRLVWKSSGFLTTSSIRTMFESLTAVYEIF